MHCCSAKENGGNSTQYSGIFLFFLQNVENSKVIKTATVENEENGERG